MSIAFSCQHCGKSYKVSDNLAGKPAKCKQCGNEIRVPIPAPAAAAAPEGLDLYGLDEAPVSRRGAPEEAPEAAPMPRRAGLETPPKAKRRGSKGGGGDNSMALWGIRLFVFGIGIFLLPLVGLQFKLVNFLPPEAQMGIGVGCLAAGSVCLLLGRASTGAVVASFGVLGLTAILFLVISVVIPDRKAGKALADQPPQPPAPRLAGALAEPLPRPQPFPAPPTFPAPPPLPPPPSFLAPNQVAPQVPSAFETAARSGETKVVLSNARIDFQRARFGSARMQLRVDFRFESGWGKRGDQYVLVVESASGMRLTFEFMRLATQGNLVANLNPANDTGATTFKTYMRVRSVGTGGGDVRTISEALSVPWAGEPEGAAADAQTVPSNAPPRFPGMPPFPRPRGPRMRFGPRGGP